MPPVAACTFHLSCERELSPLNTWVPGLPSLDTTKPSGVDAWFLKFESRMKAAQVAVSLWAEKVEECPRVPQSIKTRLPCEALTDYAATRLWVLKEHGPLNPVGHFRAMIYKVRGETRDTVREETRTLSWCFITVPPMMPMSRNGPSSMYKTPYPDRSGDGLRVYI